MTLNIPSRQYPQQRTASLLVCAAVLGLAPSSPLNAQIPEIERLSIGATVELDTKQGDFKGTVVGLDEGSIALQVNGDPNEGIVTVARSSVESMRVKDSGPLWVYPLHADPSGIVLMDASRGNSAPSYPLMTVDFDDRIVALDASTGALRWELEKSADANVELRSTSFPGLGLLTEDSVLNGVDLTNGEMLWRRSGLSDSLHAMVSFPCDSLILQFRIDESDRVRMLALDAMTGKQVWETTDFVTEKLAKDGSLQVVRFEGCDHATLVYLSRDGPFLIDVRSGEVLWRGATLKGRPVPSRRNGSAFATADDSLVYVPMERGVAAFDRASGETRWEMWDDDSLRPRLLKKTPWGLLVFAWKTGDGRIKKTQFYMLDRATGERVWKVKNAGGGHVFLRADSVFVGGPKKIVAVDIEHGTLTEVAKVKVWRGAKLRNFEMDRDGYYFGWAFGASALSRDGQERFELHLEPPGQSFSEAMISGSRRRVGVGTSRDWYVFTGEPIEDKTFGFSIARIDMESGDIVGRVYLDDRTPSYHLNSAADLVFVRRDDQIAAYAFVGCRAVEYAAATGDTALLNLLAAKGVAPTSPAGRHCHPLRSAARYGQDAAVWQLVRAGWMAESSEDGWSPIHYAANYGHLGAVQILLEAGSSPDAPTADAFPWTPLLLATRWGHDEIVAEIDEAGVTTSPARRLLVKSMRMAETGDLIAANQARVLISLLPLDQTLPPQYRSLFCYRTALAGRPEEALADCDAGVETDPESAYAYSARAYARGLAGDSDGAASDLKTLFRLDPYSEHAQHYLHRAYEYEAGRHPLTEEHLEELRQATSLGWSRTE